MGLKKMAPASESYQELNGQQHIMCLMSCVFCLHFVNQGKKGVFKCLNNLSSLRRRDLKHPKRLRRRFLSQSHFFVVSITFFADNMKKLSFWNLLDEGKWVGGKPESVSLHPKVHMLLSSNLFEMLSAPNLLGSLQQRFSCDVILRHMPSSTSKSAIKKFQIVKKFPTTGKKGLKTKKSLIQLRNAILLLPSHVS